MGLWRIHNSVSAILIFIIMLGMGCTSETFEVGGIGANELEHWMTWQNEAKIVAGLND